VKTKIEQAQKLHDAGMKAHSDGDHSKSGSLTLSRDLYGFLGTINLSSFGKRRDFGDIELPAYSLVNLSFTKELNKKTKISFKLENMLDKEYYTAATSNAFYMSQGRSIWFKLHYDLGR
jgi:outer membrane cobalamin receptor